MSRNCLEGVVIAGFKQAGKLGYPTANVLLPPDLVPPAGVYASWVDYKHTMLAGALVVGVEPAKSEVYILDWSGDLYRQKVKIYIVQKVSDIQFFDDRSLLIRKIVEDVARVRQVLNQSPKSDLCLPE